MEIIGTIFSILLFIISIGILWIVVSFFMDVPSELRRIASALEKRNDIEKEKLEIMKNNNNIKGG